MITMVLTLLNRKKEAKKFLSTMMQDPRFKPHMDVVKHMHQMSQTKRGFMNLKAMFKSFHEEERKEHQALPPMPKEMAKFMRNSNTNKITNHQSDSISCVKISVVVVLDSRKKFLFDWKVP